ncbi:MAG TPA: TIGR00730 family Rossman fold protein [Terriglobales bacterium]|nr:TIGR00730 family Rossman fold protein [Terriglobales bacterium]
MSRVCVYCASSEYCHPEYMQAAHRLGEILARNSIEIVYGGGALGLMGQVANGALANGGKVIGIMPRFMQELEWSHRQLTELRVVENMRERKHLMLTGSNAVIALPGGCGTLEELFETITLKRLAIYLNPIVLVNIRRFFDPCIALLERCVQERFMNPQHLQMWQVVERPDDVLHAISSSLQWTEKARALAAVAPQTV